MSEWDWVKDIKPAVDWTNVKDLDGRRFYTYMRPNLLFEFNSNWANLLEKTTSVQNVGEVNPNQSVHWSLNVIKDNFDRGVWVWVN
tara:strand:+ start:801 stop:1058 length:258 start_codon:yes stop_codon:yes gene_type:complete